jgi:hypothetical protein
MHSVSVICRTVLVDGNLFVFMIVVYYFIRGRQRLLRVSHVRMRPLITKTFFADASRGEVMKIFLLVFVCLRI